MNLSLFDLFNLFDLSNFQKSQVPEAQCCRVFPTVPAKLFHITSCLGYDLAQDFLC